MISSADNQFHNIVGDLMKMNIQSRQSNVNYLNKGV
jgi:hypothetical protein